MKKTFEGPRFSVETHQVEFPNGQAYTKDIVDAPNTAGIFITDCAGKVLIIKELSPTTKEPSYGLPKGCILNGETLKQATANISLNECSVKIWGIKQICTPCRLAPSFVNELFYPTEAHVAEYTDMNPREEKGIIDVSWMPITDVLDRIKNQLKYGIPFKDGIEMDGKSIFVFIAKKFLED